VARVALDGQGRVLRQEPFIEGWLQTDARGRESEWGRPADVLPLPDGSLLISDDLAGAIYRVRYAP
jgi:glucose/arabinose dehydrogenase